MLAANNGHVDIVRLLQAQHPRPNLRLRNLSGQNALDLVRPHVVKATRSEKTDDYVALSKILIPMKRIGD